MRGKMMGCLVILVWYVSAASAHAASTVVIPLKMISKMKNVVTVSASGGDYTDPVAAVDAITDASATNPYLV